MSVKIFFLSDVQTLVVACYVNSQTISEYTPLKPLITDQLSKHGNASECGDLAALQSVTHFLLKWNAEIRRDN